MAEDKKLVEAITSMKEDFAQWYTDVCKKAELMSYSSVKGCMIFKPAGYAIWENIKNEMDRRCKETGVENVYLPMFIPESLLEVEKDHVEGFAPEVAWVTYGGLNPLQERMCVRPTSETLFCEFNKDEIRIHDYKNVQESFYGRKAIQHMLQQKRLRHVHSRCLTFTLTSVRKFLQFL